MLKKVYNIDDITAQLFSIELNMIPLINELKISSIEEILKDSLSQLKDNPQEIIKNLSLLELSEIIDYLDFSSEKIVNEIFSRDCYRIKIIQEIKVL